MIREKLWCVSGPRKGEYFEVNELDPITSVFYLKGLADNCYEEWNPDSDESDYVIQGIENGVFFHIPSGMVMLIDSDPVYEDGDYYIHFSSVRKGSFRISSSRFLRECRRVVTFKLIREEDGYFAIYSYPNVLEMVGLPEEVIYNHLTKGKKVSKIYAVGFWVGTDAPGFLNSVKKGYMDW